MAALAGLRTMKNSGPVVVGTPVRSTVTSLYVCQPPVGVMSTEPTRVPVSALPVLICTVPPAPPEETRNRTWVMPLRLIGV